MEAVNLDGIRMDIFREIIKLDEKGLQEVYKYILSRFEGDKAEEKKILKELLLSSAKEALETQKEGRMCCTEIAMAKLDQAMQWE